VPVGSGGKACCYSRGIVVGRRKQNFQEGRSSGQKNVYCVKEKKLNKSKPSKKKKSATNQLKGYAREGLNRVRKGKGPLNQLEALEKKRVGGGGNAVTLQVEAYTI